MTVHVEHEHHPGCGCEPVGPDDLAGVAAELRAEVQERAYAPLRELADLLRRPLVTRTQPAGRFGTGGRRVSGTQYQGVRLLGADPARLRVFVAYWPATGATNAGCAIAPEESSGSLGYRLPSAGVEYLFQTTQDVWVSSANDAIGTASDDFYVSWRAEYVDL